MTINVKNVLLALNEHPIAYYGIYADITGSVTAGILLSQLMYWSSKMHGQEFYKIDKELMAETRLGSKELRNAKNKIQSLQLCQIQRKGVPARSFYFLNFEEISKRISQFMAHKHPVDNSASSYAETAHPVIDTSNNKLFPSVVPKGRNWKRRNGTTTTETTPEITKENTYVFSKNEKKSIFKNDQEITAEYKDMALAKCIHNDWVQTVFDDFREYWSEKGGEKSAKEWLRLWGGWCMKSPTKCQYAKPDGAVAQNSTVYGLTFNDGNLEWGSETPDTPKKIPLYTDPTIGGAFRRYDKQGIEWNYSYGNWHRTGKLFEIGNGV